MASNNSANPEEKNEQSKASQIIANNYDLSTQILLRAPPTSISNLKLASKLWHSISTNPTFIRNHTRHYSLALAGLFIHYTTRPQDVSHEYVAFKPSYSEANTRELTTFVAAQNSLGLNVLQSCNGLLLCCSYDTKYYVCNPTTLQRKRVELPRGVLLGGDYGLNLAFDPRISTSYKIVCVRKVIGQQSRYQVEIYSSETGQWKTVGEPFVESNVLHFKHGVFCKGAIHWLKTTSACRYFDVDRECMRSTPDPPPEKQCPAYSHRYFGRSNDHLYFIIKRHLPNFTLLQMKDDYSGWFVKYAINLDVLSQHFPIMARKFDRRSLFFRRYECDVLCIEDVEGDSGIDESDVELVISLPGKIVRFNPRINASKQVGDLELQPYSKVWYKGFLVHEYFASISPV